MQKIRNFPQKLCWLYILKRCGELLQDLDGVTIEGPHPYKMLHKLVQKRNIRIIVFKDNKIKFAFPREYDGKRMQICLLETSPNYLQDDNRLHCDFIKNAKKFFYEKMFQCTICLQWKSLNKNHNKCIRSQCKFCFKIQLQKDDYFDLTMKSEYCNRLTLEDNPYHKCNLCKKDVPHSCLQTHLLLCKRMYECKSCGLVLHAKSIKALQVNVDKHKCFSKLCKICFTHIPPNDFKQHACVLKDVKWHSVYNR